MKPRTAWFLLGALVALLLITCTHRVHAQSLEVRQLLQDRGWHGVGGGVQVHQGTLEFSPPWVGVWQRSAAPSGHYGDWLYMKVLINCEQWSQVPFATLDPDWNVVLIGDLTGQDPVSRWPEAGTEPHRTMTAVCALYGYSRQARPILRPNPNGAPYVGGIKRLDR